MSAVRGAVAEFSVSGVGHVSAPLEAVGDEEAARRQAVACFRELADRLERGELVGARAQWRPGRPIETVELVSDSATYRTIDTPEVLGMRVVEGV
jgi:hypothetical protein